MKTVPGLCRICRLRLGINAQYDAHKRCVDSIARIKQADWRRKKAFVSEALKNYLVERSQNES